MSSHDESSSEEEITTVTPKSVENVTVTSFPTPQKPTYPTSNYTSTTEQPTTELPPPGPTFSPPVSLVAAFKSFQMVPNTIHTSKEWARNGKDNCVGEKYLFDKNSSNMHGVQSASL